MTFFEVFIIAVALAADAFSVALIVSIKGCNSAKHIVRLASIFGFFQFFMPLVGFFLFNQVHDFIEAFDHWVAFILLAVVGGKMLWEGYTHDGTEEEASNATDPTKGLTAITLAIATSIDALAVGGTFATLHLDVWIPALIIGIVCFVMTALGMIVSRCILQKNTLIVKYANMIGGIILIGIGLRILLPDLYSV